MPGHVGTPFVKLESNDNEEESKASHKLFLKVAEDSLFSLCMSLRRIPNITYSLESKVGRKLAERLSSRMEREYTQNHKEFLQENVELLIFDRKEDPVTPLIYNWGYQSMIGEFIGIDNNAVKVHGKPEIYARQTEDLFIEKNWIKNYGEFTMDLSAELERLYKEKNCGAKMENLEDFQAALDKMPDLTKDAKNLRKHSDLIRTLAETIQSRDIYSVSQLQQDIITENNKANQFKDVLNALVKKNVTALDKTKLVMLYCLKYNDDMERVTGLQRALAAQSIPTVILSLNQDLVKEILEYSGVSKRSSSDLFNVTDIFDKVSTNLMSKFKVNTSIANTGRRKEHIREVPAKGR